MRNAAFVFEVAKIRASSISWREFFFLSVIVVSVLVLFLISDAKLLLSFELSKILDNKIAEKSII